MLFSRKGVCAKHGFYELRFGPSLSFVVFVLFTFQLPFFLEMGEKDFQSLIEEFPEFTNSDIIDLRLQFQTFDLNQDGIIDFNEL